MAALTPFQYLRDNLQIIDEVAPDTHKRGMWLLASLFREPFFRMLFIFVPVIALIGGLYELISPSRSNPPSERAKHLDASLSSSALN